MPSGPHVPSIEHIRTALGAVPDAIRYEDPATDERGTGSSPAVAVWVSDPDREEDASSAVDPDFPLNAQNVEVGLSEAVIEQPSVAFEIPPEITDSDIYDVIGEDQRARIEQLSKLIGSDAYAWYTTFHQKRFQYGVHIPLEGVLAFALDAFPNLDLPLERKAQLAFHAILRHELFHFNADCMIANWELATGAPVFWNAKERYGQTRGYVLLEEGLANAYMLRGFKHRVRPIGNAAGAYQALKRFCGRQPEGYCDGANYVKTRGPHGKMDSFFDACCELSAQYQHASEPSWRPPDTLDPLLLYPDLIHIDWTRCPIIVLDEHNLRDALGIGISFFQAITEIEETDAFLKRLRKLDRSLQRQWQTSKEKLALSTSLGGLGFQPWKRDGAEYFSVNVGGNYRAHLRRARGEARWFAERIGNHKEMGHG